MKAFNLHKEFCTWLARVVFCSLLAVFSGGLTASADGLDHWHWRNPLPAGNSLNSIAFGNGVFVAVGPSGAAQTSSDGLAWTVLDPLGTNDLARVIFANGLFVTVGDHGTILTSTNGAQWTAPASGTTNLLLAIAYGNSMFAASGTAGTIVTSPDGVNWTAGNVGSTNDLDWIAFGNGVFVAPTPQPSGPWYTWPLTNSVWVSSNALNWSQKLIDTHGYPAQVKKAAFGNGRFLARINVFTNSYMTQQAYYFTSTDGINWGSVYLPPASTWHSLVSANNLFFVGEAVNAGPNVINVSADGQTWTTTSVPVNYLWLNDVAFGAGHYVLAGANGLLMNSPDGTTWTVLGNTPPGGTAGWTALVRGQGKMVAVGGGLLAYYPRTSGPAPIMVCTNGTTFFDANATLQSLTSVAFGGSNFVAVGVNGALQRSTNGLDWIVRPSGTTANLGSVCYGNGTWVAVGAGGTVVTSSNTLVWALRFSTTSELLYAVTCGNGLFVAVGDQGTVLTSPDGFNWSPQYTDTLAPLYNVTYGNGQFVAVGNAGTVVTSSDGYNWVTQSSGTSVPLFGIAAGAGQFVAAGSRYPLGNETSLNNVILRSYDGVAWQAVTPPTGWDLDGIIFDNGTFWATGGNGAILQSDPVAAQPMLTGRMLTNPAAFELTINYLQGLNFRVQVSANGGGWSDALTVTNCLPVETWVDTNAASSFSRLYRVIAP